MRSLKALREAKLRFIRASCMRVITSGISVSQGLLAPLIPSAALVIVMRSRSLSAETLLQVKTISIRSLKRSSSKDLLTVLSFIAMELV